MHIRDALIDEQTGAVLVRGKIEFADTLALDERFRVPEHSMILVDFNVDGSGDFAVRPLVSFERLETGFCKAETKGAYLRLPTLNNWFLLNSRAQYARLTGGWLCLPPNVCNEFYYVIGMEVETEIGEDGLAFKIAGVLTGKQSDGDHRSGFFAPRGAHAETRFWVSGTISWPILKILGLASSSAENRYLEGSAILEVVDHIGSGSPNLEDVRDYVSGWMRFEAPSEARSYESAASILALSFWRDTLHFSYCGPLNKLSNGFYEPLDAARYSTHNLSIYGLGKAELLRRTGFWFPPRQSALACQGDHLGVIGFEAAVTRGALQTKICQEIASFDMRAENTDRGVHLDITGTLRPFKERAYELYMENLEDGQHSEVRPWETFSLRADIPRALFIAQQGRKSQPV